jgi:hypothetical protein
MIALGDKPDRRDMAIRLDRNVNSSVIGPLQGISIVWVGQEELTMM